MQDTLNEYHWLKCNTVNVIYLFTILQTFFLISLELQSGADSWVFCTRQNIKNLETITTKNIFREEREEERTKPTKNHQEPSKPFLSLRDGFLSPLFHKNILWPTFNLNFNSRNRLTKPFLLTRIRKMSIRLKYDRSGIEWISSIIVFYFHYFFTV